MNRSTLSCLVASVAAVTVLAGVAVTSGTAAADDPTPDIESLELELVARAYATDYLTRDSDGDGWSDWIERLEGTDPGDPASHPTSARIDIAPYDGGATVFVQSTVFPDRLVALDGLKLPERVDSVGQLLDLVGQITGGTTLGKFGAELDALAKEHGAQDQLSSILEGVAAHHTSVDIRTGGRTNGQLEALISVDGSGIRFWGAADGLHVKTERAQLDDAGTGIVFVEETVNFERVRLEHRHYYKGQHTGTVVYDGKGNKLDESIAPVTTVAETKAPTTTVAVSSGGTSSSGGSTTTVPKDTETTTATTAKGDYTNPDDDATLWQLPTPAEIEARIAFLGGIRTRYTEKPEIVTDSIPERPGVHDPAEPPCEQEGCVAFTEVVAPDLSSMTGGCPPTFCRSGRP